LSCGFLDFLKSDRFDGFKEKNATSEADTNPDDIINSIQKIIKK
jgi:hypothetical protein